MNSRLWRGVGVVGEHGKNLRGRGGARGLPPGGAHPTESGGVRRRGGGGGRRAALGGAWRVSKPRGRRGDNHH